MLHQFLLERFGPELRQYIVTSNDEERPFSRDQRRWVYSSAKSEPNTFGFGTDNTVNCYAGVYIGPECLFADSVYIVDFDHNYWDPVIAIRSQGITKKPVRLEGDIWVGEKTSILRGVTVGRGSVIGAMSLVNRDVPPYAVVGGVPARVLGWRPRPLAPGGEGEAGEEENPLGEECYPR